MVTIVGKFLQNLYQDCGLCSMLEFEVEDEIKPMTFFIWAPDCDYHKPKVRS